MTKTNKRAWPWCLVPDSIWFVCGLSIAACMLPGLAIIATTTVAYLVMGTPTCPNWLRWRVFYPIAKSHMMDPRSADYLIPMTVQALLLPTLAWAAWTDYVVNNRVRLPVAFALHCLRVGPRFRNFAFHQVLIHKVCFFFNF